MYFKEEWQNDNIFDWDNSWSRDWRFGHHCNFVGDGDQGRTRQDDENRNVQEINQEWCVSACV